MEFYYCILPAGNRSEFPELDCELIRRGVDAHVTFLKAGGRIYRVHEFDLHKLPVDDRGAYLGDNNSGYSVYKMADAEYNRVDWGGSDWISLQ